MANFLTCILAGFVVFSYMGSLSRTIGLSMDKVVQSGPGLIYVVYPFAVTTIKGSILWSILFFLMMLFFKNLFTQVKQSLAKIILTTG
jgi:SNF family Na+-dependent transporter